MDFVRRHAVALGDARATGQLIRDRDLLYCFFYVEHATRDIGQNVILLTI
jgi:hypothetical protein